MSSDNLYTTHNIRYLRISEKQVLPLIIYLRQENLLWFNDIIFQEILSALQRIIPKIFSRKKKNVSNKLLSDIYRGSNFQFAYYIKPTEVKHSILIKDKTSIFPSDKMNASVSKSQMEQENINLNLTYQGYNIFRKSLVLIVEPLDKIIEFGDNVQIATAMTIDDYFGRDEESEL
ncbi:4463_t:CDS:2 [Funneliformis geosporum]|uniref:6994_t:CDS:1 n=1 Tax=Funneliformis geosporum TaxID=1117311 RepID=A0A9W4SUF5_9GLOM|nr:6994_t:CDS:2 [Funneliformis geosporum]CAI2181879.1 4463_t:CDS:2 [Funneliformis geosporum]